MFTAQAARRMVGACLGTVVLLVPVACSSTGVSVASTGEQFCALLGVFEASNNTLDATFDSGDKAAVRLGLEKMTKQITTLAAESPQAVRPELTSMDSFMTQLNQLLGKFDYDVDALQADAAGLAEFETLPLDDFSASLQVLNDYNASNCVAATVTATS